MFEYYSLIEELDRQKFAPKLWKWRLLRKLQQQKKEEMKKGRRRRRKKKSTPHATILQYLLRRQPEDAAFMYELDAVHMPLALHHCLDSGGGYNLSPPVITLLFQSALWNGTYSQYALVTYLFDTATTVDPSYVISLIRKLIPSGERTEHGSHHHASIQGVETSSVEQSNGVPPDHGCCNGGQGRSNTEGTIPNQENPQDILTDDDDMNPEFELRERYGGDTSERPRVSLSEDPWEEYGCILWDLAANETHAVLMVENLLPEVLLTSLVVSKSVRVTEICLGILGNLACHEGPRNALSSANGLVETVVNQLFLDDSLCLSGTCWCSILDSILCSVESLSITSDYSQAVSSNVELFQLICGMIKLPDKIEVADSCVTTVVLVANILTDNPNLLPDISKDILPFVSNDSQARSALWSILARVLSTAEANGMRKLDLQQYANLLVEKSDIINEDLDDHRGEDSAEDHMNAGKTNAKKGTVSSSN
ncbi:hypothetical protein ACLOJK_020911 [Asimina triloba]